MCVAISWAKKMNFNFCVNLAGFCMDSHNYGFENALDVIQVKGVSLA